MTDLHGQRVISPEAMQAIALGEVNVVYGSTATLLTRPAGKTVLVLRADAGSFRLRLGDHVSTGMPTAFAPGAAISDGTGSWALAANAERIMPAPATMTVKGYAGTDALSYYWL